MKLAGECKERKSPGLSILSNPVIKRLALQDKGRIENDRTEKWEVSISVSPNLSHTHTPRRRRCVRALRVKDQVSLASVLFMAA